MFARNPMIIEAVQWTGHNEAEVKELAGEAFQAVIKCPGDDNCQTCGENLDITAELTINADGGTDEELEEYTQGMETGWWVVRIPDGRLACMADSTLHFNYTEFVYAGSD